MAKKTKSKTSPKPMTYAAKKMPEQIDPRKKLLCRVAGNVAGYLVGSPSPSISSASKIAEVAVDIAEEILKKVGVPSSNATASSDASVNAAAS